MAAHYPSMAQMRAPDNDAAGKWLLLYDGHDRAPGAAAWGKKMGNRRRRRRGKQRVRDGMRIVDGS